MLIPVVSFSSDMGNIVSQIKKGIQNPSLAMSVLKNDLLKIQSRITRTLFSRNDPPIPERDWDNCLILDAARYDLFKKHNTLSGNLDVSYSIAASTAEYLRKTFKNKEYPDIVCVTSQPKYRKEFVENSFHEVIHVWKNDWDQEYRMVLPEIMNRRVLETIEKFPNKRILAHYIPPHGPYIGETGQQMPPHRIHLGSDLNDENKEKPWLKDLIIDGEVTKEEYKRAYEENMEIAISGIKEIVADLPGKTVVTADHGQAFGHLSEFGVVGHPSNLHIRPLIEVPWLVNHSGNRKDLESGDIADNQIDISDSVVQERLEDLGYVE